MRAACSKKTCEPWIGTALSMVRGSSDSMRNWRFRREEVEERDDLLLLEVDLRENIFGLQLILGK